MNWKNVLHLIQVERKSGRLIRGKKTTKYHENRFMAYWPYWLALVLGIAGGLLIGLVLNSAISADPEFFNLLRDGTLSLFFSLPTLVLIYSLIFTMMQQIRLSGVKTSSQVPYWLPITWQEHTMGSILASLIGFPLASVVFIVSIVIVFSLFIGLIVAAVLTSLAVLAAAFMASAGTEILRVLQVRFIGAIYKSSGRAAVWVRFAGSLIFFIVFYIGYFYVTSGGAITVIQTIASAQTAAWFIPFVWLGVSLYYFTVADLLLGFIFASLAISFIVGLFLLATLLNKRFGLYEPAAITVSRGVYAPKTGLLDKIGFSPVEAAIIRKDLKAFTRRRELMTIFIFPIVIILVPLMQSIGQGTAMPSQVTTLLVAVTFLFPASVMAMSLGSFMIGEEGQTIWRVYASPVSAASLVKSKYFFVNLFSFIVLVTTTMFGYAIYQPSLRTTFIAFIEAVFLVLAVGANSLGFGISGADFTEMPRHRMIRPSASILSLIVSVIAGVAILAPFFQYALLSIMPTIFAGIIGTLLDPLLAVVFSAIIAIVLTLILYQIALRKARNLLAKAEI